MKTTAGQTAQSTRSWGEGTVMMMAPMTILIRDKLINNCPFQRDTRGRLTLFSGGGGGIGC